MIHQISSTLHHILKDPLPGEAAHRKMMPEARLYLPPVKQPVEAAVFILIYINGMKQVSSVLIKRPKYKGHHSNQISLPGGKFDKKHDQHLEDTAFRELNEELGINKKDIELIDKLTTLHIPISGFDVTPFIGLFKADEEIVFKPDAREVKDVIEYEIKELINPLVRKTTNTNWNGHSVEVPYFDINNELVWGATAMILAEFAEIWKKAGF